MTENTPRHDPIKALAASMPTTFLRAFFDEKDIPEITWEIEDKTGMTHWMPNVVVVEHIAIFPKGMIDEIVPVLRKIDRLNGNVNDFLKHIAFWIINNREAA